MTTICTYNINVSRFITELENLGIKYKVKKNFVDIQEQDLNLLRLTSVLTIVEYQNLNSPIYIAYDEEIDL